MDPAEERRDSKRQQEYLNHLGNVADSEYGMPRRCACGGRMIDELRVKDEFDTQPGKRFFSCVNYELFAKHQESTRKDVERAFGVLQSRFAIVKNPGLLWDKEKLRKIMRTCVILHNMIVENERGGYTLSDTSQFESGESSRSSKVKRRESLHSNNMLGMRNEVRNSGKHDSLKADLVENVWQKFGNIDE
ncbi:hypothetical protein Bca4012_028887 [Brassica carinata]